MSAGPILSIAEAAAKYKMIYVGKCHCDGTPTEKYSDSVYTLYWRRNKYVFRLMSKNTIIKNWTPVSQLVDFLASHFNQEKKIDAGREN